jgi:hypothetical protein
MYKYLKARSFSTKNPFAGKSLKNLKIGSQTYNYYDINTLGSQTSK